MDDLQARLGGRGGEDHPPAVLAAHRALPLRLVGREVGERRGVAALVELPDQRPGDLALVEPRPPLLGDAAQRGGQLRLPEDVSRLERPAPRPEDAARTAGYAVSFAESPAIICARIWLTGKPSSASRIAGAITWARGSRP